MEKDKKSITERIQELTQAIDELDQELILDINNCMSACRQALKNPARVTLISQSAWKIQNTAGLINEASCERKELKKLLEYH